MSKLRFVAPLCAVAILCLCAAGVHHFRQSRKAPSPGVASKGGTSPRPRLLASAVASIPLSFEKNGGVDGTGVRFVSRGPGYGLSLSTSGAVLVHRTRVHQTQANMLSSMASVVNPDQVGSNEVRLTWLGANSSARAEALDRQRGTSNYLLGNDRRGWRTNVPRYGRVRFVALYHGVDLIYRGNQGHTEMDYVLSPKADPRSIRIGIGGPSIVGIDPDGNLSISVQGDEVLLKKPVAYQQIGGKRQSVGARYVLESSHTVGFALDQYDSSQPLIIDPVLDFAAAFGGEDDIIADVATDAQRNLYLAGTTCSVSYPVTSGALQGSGGSTTSRACNDVIVTKLDPTASSLIYSTYIGGSSVDFAVRILVDASGNVLLAGSTASTDFPTTSGVYQRAAKGGTCSYGPFIGNQTCSDGFVLKLDPEGSHLVFSTLLGGERIDLITALAQDVSSGNIYVAGATNSTQFPIPGAAAQSTYGGDNGHCELLNGATAPCLDAFVAELDPTGSKLLAATYLGGNDDDGATAIALDGTPNVYVTGSANSATFPTTVGAYQTTHTAPIDQGDVFVTKLNSSLSSIVYSTFIGGSSDDFGTRIRVDAPGAAYVTGSTSSSDFPVTAGAFQNKYAGPNTLDCPLNLDSAAHGLLYCGDAFVAKVSPDGRSLVFSTYLGGSQDEGALNMALDSSANVWVAGTTQSSDFPLTTDAYYSSQGAGTAFLTEIKSDGTQNLFSTRLPGQQALAIEIDGSDNVVVAGPAATNLAGPATVTPGAYTNGQGGVFVVKFSPGAAPGLSITSTSSQFTNTSGVYQIAFPRMETASVSAPVPLTLQNTGAATLHLAISILMSTSKAPSLAFFESDNCGSSLAASASCTVKVFYQPSSGTTSDGATLAIQDDAPNAPHGVFLSGSSETTLTASFVPATLDFGRSAANTTSATQTAVLNGTGSTGPRTTGAYTMSGDTAAFAVTNSSSCAVGSFFCTIVADFSPPTGTTPGAKMMQVSVPTTGPNSPQVLTLTGIVTASPVLAVSMNPVNFSPTDQGTTSHQTIRLSNVGGATLNITGANFSNPAFSYDTTSGCGGNPAVITLVPSGTCLFSILFSPTTSTTAGVQAGTLTFNGNDPSAPAVSIAGNVTTPSSAHLVFTPSVLSSLPNGTFQFADTIVGMSTTPIASLSTLQNLSGGSAQITTIMLSSPDFTLDQTDTAANCPNSGKPPITLTAGTSCTVYVYFTPQATGVRNGSLTLQTQDTAIGTKSTFIANLTGNGVLEPAVSLSPTRLSFGNVAVGQNSGPLTSVLINAGGAPLSVGISNVSVPAQFSQTNNCPASLPSGASCIFTVKFTPSSTGPASGLLIFPASASGGTFAIAMTGTGVRGPVLSAQPPSLSFLGQSIGTASAAQQVMLANVGDTAASISAIHSTTSFKQSNTCPSSLAAGASCILSVSFAPTVDNFPAFTVMGTVLIDNNGPGSPFPIPLSGESLATNAAATSANLTSSANPAAVGQTVAFTATVNSTKSGTFIGAFTFYDGATQLGQIFVPAGQSSVTVETSTLAPGAHLIYATYSGDPTFNSSISNTVPQIMAISGHTNSSTALATSGSPSTVGQSLTFTATVTPASGATTPTGIATFYDGGSLLGSSTLDASGKATLTTSMLSAGKHSIAATYGGDANYNGSASSTVSQVVNAAAKTNTSTTLTSSLNPSLVGQSVTFTTTVTPTSGTTVLTGSVSFTDGANSLGSPVLLDASGKATLTTSGLIAGTHSITAIYSGDSTFATSTSNPLSQVVNSASAGPDFSIRVQQTSLTLTAGQSGALNVTVTPTGGFNQAVNFACTGLPAYATCSGAPVTPNGTPANGTISVQTMSRASVPGAPRFPTTPIGAIAAGIAAIALLAWVAARSRRQRLRIILTCGMFSLGVALLSCSGGGYGGGGGGTSGTPAGTYTITITGTSGGTVHTAPTTVALTVN